MKINLFNDNTQRVLKFNNDHLKQFYEKCQKDKLIGIDTEFYRVDSYFPKLCLIQLSNSTESILLDPITEKINFVLLKKLLFNTKIKKIFHAARQDIEIFYNIYGKIPRPIIDTQICLLALGYSHSISYAKACKDLLNIELDKNNQFVDWRKRPLDKKKLLYAVNDVKFLIPLFKIINKKLKNQDYRKLDNHYKKIIDIKIYSEKAERAWEKLKFSPSNNLELNSLKRYCKIREKMAMKKNVPVKQIISDSEIKIISRLNEFNPKKQQILKKLNIKN